MAGFAASVIPATAFDTREIAALFPFGAVLAGRVFGPWLAAARLRAVALGLACACQLAALGYAVAQPPAADPARTLAGFLAARHLTCGLGTFGDGNISTLDSGGAVRLLPVSWLPPAPTIRPLLNPHPQRRLPLPLPGGVAVPRLYQSAASWYDPRTGFADFIVTGGAGQDLPGPVVHGHGLEHEPAGAARPHPVAGAGRHRAPLSRPALFGRGDESHLRRPCAGQRVR
jgi:hypothetical protein